MRNTWGLPIVGLIAAAILAIIVMGSHGFNSDHLSEMELGAVAGALCFFIYGIQGVVSVLIDGEELKPGKRAAHHRTAYDRYRRCFSALAHCCSRPRLHADL